MRLGTCPNLSPTDRLGLVRVKVLGPIMVGADGGTSHLDNCERAVLGCLIAQRDHYVSRDALIDAVWPIQAPKTARKTLQGLVLRVRKVVGFDAITSIEGGYHLNSERIDLDLTEFKTLVESGRDAIRTGELGIGIESLERALLLWRGEPYGNLGETCVAMPERRWLGEVRYNALEMLASGLVLDNSSNAATEILERLVAEEPLRESAWVSLGMALVAGGRRAEALAVCSRARRVLIEELGATPGGALQALERDLVANEKSPVASLNPGASCRCASEHVRGLKVRTVRSTRMVSAALRDVTDRGMVLQAV